MLKLSHIISWIFLPLLMPLYALLIVMFCPSSPVDLSQVSPYDLPAQIKWVLWSVFVIFCFIAPGLSYYGLYRFKVITTLDMESRVERRVPLFIMLGYNALLLWFMYQSDPQGILPDVFIKLPLAGLLVTAVFTIITSSIKISMHAGGCGICTGFLYTFYQEQHNPSLMWLTIAFMVSGLVVGSRWYLKKHTFWELFTGFIIAFLITLQF